MDGAASGAGLCSDRGAVAAGRWCAVEFGVVWTPPTSRRAFLRAALAGAMVAALGVLPAGCAARRQRRRFAGVLSREWTLAMIDGRRPPLSHRPTLVFEGGRAFGRAYINQYSAACVLRADGTVLMDAIMSTKMGGPAEWMEDEGRYFARLAAAKTWKVEGGTLTLTGAEGESLTFTRP